ADLEEVVHDPDRVEAHLVGGPRDAGQGRPDLGRPTGPGELVDLEAELHGALIVARSPRVARLFAIHAWWAWMLSPPGTGSARSPVPTRPTREMAEPTVVAKK